MRTLILCSVLALIWLAALATPAGAQSAIAGVVRDATGGVLPGVTVEAASPALIEKIRSVETDASGQYKIVDLRPGTYSVTFTLAGFSTVRREGIELPATFTATVNADMKVGAVEETIMVTGETPVVDVQGSVAQSVMNRKVLDAIPTGRDVFAVGQVIPGVTTATPDVGGTQGMQQPVLQVHGSNTRDMVYQQDGMVVNDVFGNGNQTGFYYSDLNSEEISYQTSALPAEVGLGGVRINMITKQGGNDFHGALFATGANSSMQSNNQSAELRAKGLVVPNSVDTIYDINASFGGPIKRDRLWFFGSFRRWGANRFVANTFNPDGTQAIDDNRLSEGTIRFTVSPNRKNKIVVGYDRGAKYRGHRRDNQPASFVQPEAALLQTVPSNYILQTSWTSTLTNRLLLSAGLSWMYNYIPTGYRPETKPTDVTKYDIGKSLLYNAPIYNLVGSTDVKTYVASISYVTGQHNLKAGLQIRSGTYFQNYQKNGDLLLQFINGVSNSVLEYNTPVGPHEHLDADDGFYVQDSWTMKRLTVNGGLRVDYFKLTNPAQSSPAGTWVPARNYPETPVISWTNVVPRVGVVYDLSGNGKTAIKASASQYVESEGVQLGQLINPLFLSSQTCAWRDLNGDTNAQPNEITSCQGFTGGVSTRIDPKLSRPTQWEYVAQIQHELMPRFSVTAGYYHRRISRLYGVRNQLVPPSTYTPITITNPLDGTPFTIYNQDPATRGQQDLLLTNQDALWSRYHGFEIKAEKRFANRAAILGGFTAGRNRGNIRSSSVDLNNPNNLINAIAAVGYDATYQVNVAGSWMLPLGIQWSGSLRTATGLPLQRILTVTRTLVPNMTQVTQNVDLVPSGTVRLQNPNLLDMRILKIFTIKGARLQLIADVYNILNSNATTSEVQTIGASLGRPSAILDGRLLRLGVQMTF